MCFQHYKRTKWPQISKQSAPVFISFLNFYRQVEMEKESNQLFISAEIFRWSFIEIDQAQEFPQNGREMSNKHPWKYNHYRIIKILKGALFVPISHFSWEAQSRFFSIKLKWKVLLLHCALGPNPKLAKPCLKRAWRDHSQKEKKMRRIICKENSWSNNRITEN